MRRLVLVHHSMPEIAISRPASSWKLGETGRRRSELLADRLREFRPQVIWSSTEPKAVETAEIIAKAIDVTFSTMGGLEEHARNTVPFFETGGEFERAVERFFREPDRLVLGEETAEQVLGRFVNAIDDIISTGHVDTLVVTHGSVMTLYAASVAGVCQMRFWRSLGMPSYVVLTLPDMHIQSVVLDVNSSEVSGHGT